MSNDLTLKKDDVVANKSDATIKDALLRVCENPDIDPDRLEKFLDLQIKMEDRQAKSEFQKALSLFQQECPVIKKTKKIDFASKSGNRTKYNYSPLDEIVHVIKPIMAAYGLSYTFNLKEIGSDKSELITTIYHSSGYEKSFSYFFNPLHDDQRMNQSQRAKSAVTYAKRAGLENALGIVTAEEDDDARRALDSAITESQLEEINKLIKNTNTQMDQLLRFLKVDELTDLSSYEAKKAINVLKQKRVACTK